MSQPRAEKKEGGFCRRIRALFVWWETRSRRCKAIFLLFLIVLIKMMHSQLDTLFGFGTLKGGIVGQYIDGRVRRYSIRTNIQTRTIELAELGIQLPTLDIRNNRFIKEIPSPYGQLAERMKRTALNQKKIETAEELAEQWTDDGCERSTSSLLFPRQILQPSVGNWYRQLAPSNLTVIDFDEDAMVRFVKKRFPELIDKFISIRDDSAKVQFFQLLALYWFGGYTFGSFVGDVAVLVNDATSIFKHIPCVDRAVVYGGQLDGQIAPSIAMFAASPRHKSVLCLIERVAAVNFGSDLDLMQIMLSYLSADHGSLSPPLRANRTAFINRCPDGSSSISCDYQGTVQAEYDEKVSSPCQQLIGFRTSDAFLRNLHPRTRAGLPSPQVNVDVMDFESPGIGTTKIHIGASLRQEKAWPNWLCNRCLRMERFGSFQACSYVCGRSYMESQCQEDRNQKTVNVATIRVRKSASMDLTETRIPRIVHQTWHSDLNLDEYPELSRLQNGWRASGFEYRFYNDTEARSYIEKNFPSFFLDCYDAIIPGAFKVCIYPWSLSCVAYTILTACASVSQADLFRLLVLLKDGGIYADVDVQLESANLSAFLSSDISLFIPRETVRDLAGADYCLWNGLIGSSPGHPVIAKAVERLVASIATRADYFDLERYACRANGAATSLWKLRALPTLIVSGPCALGMALNEVLGRNVLSDFTPGWAPVASDEHGGLDLGSMLVLMVSSSRLSE
jgi:mannosyltransferase OCH1-like enzyme